MEEDLLSMLNDSDNKIPKSDYFYQEEKKIDCTEEPLGNDLLTRLDDIAKERSNREEEPFEKYFYSIFDDSDEEAPDEEALSCDEDEDSFTADDMHSVADTVQAAMINNDVKCLGKSKEDAKDECDISLSYGAYFYLKGIPYDFMPNGNMGTIKFKKYDVKKPLLIKEFDEPYLRFSPELYNCDEYTFEDNFINNTHDNSETCSIETMELGYGNTYEFFKAVRDKINGAWNNIENVKVKRVDLPGDVVGNIYSKKYHRFLHYTCNIGPNKKEYFTIQFDFDMYHSNVYLTYTNSSVISNTFFGGKFRSVNYVTNDKWVYKNLPPLEDILKSIICDKKSNDYIKVLYSTIFPEFRESLKAKEDTTNWTDYNYVVSTLHLL